MEIANIQVPYALVYVQLVSSVRCSCGLSLKEALPSSMRQLRPWPGAAAGAAGDLSRQFFSVLKPFISSGEGAGLSGGRSPRPLRSRASRGAGRRGPSTRGSQSPSPAKALPGPARGRPSPARGRPGPAPPRSGSFGSGPASPLSPFLPARGRGVVSRGLQGPAGSLPEAPSAGGPEPSPFGGDVQEGVPGSSCSLKTPGPGCQRVLRAPAGSSLISAAEQTRRRGSCPGVARPPC